MKIKLLVIAAATATATALIAALPASAGTDICSNANIKRNLERSASLDQGWYTNLVLARWVKRIGESGFSSGRYIAGIFVTRCDRNPNGTYNVRLYDGLDRKAIDLAIDLQNHNLQ